MNFLGCNNAQQLLSSAFTPERLSCAGQRIVRPRDEDKSPPASLF